MTTGNTSIGTPADKPAPEAVLTITLDDRGYPYRIVFFYRRDLDEYFSVDEDLPAVVWLETDRCSAEEIIGFVTNMLKACPVRPGGLRVHFVEETKQREPSLTVDGSCNLHELLGIMTWDQEFSVDEGEDCELRGRREYLERFIGIRFWGKSDEEKRQALAEIAEDPAVPGQHRLVVPGDRRPGRCYGTREFLEKLVLGCLGANASEEDKRSALARIENDPTTPGRCSILMAWSAPDDRDDDPDSEAAPE